MSKRDEDKLQKACVKYVRNELGTSVVPYGTFFSVPNEGKRSPQLASSMLAMGLLSGVPDLILLTDKTAVFFELKSLTGTLKPKQRLVRDNLLKLGYEWHLIRTLEEFKKIVSLKLNL